MSGDSLNEEAISDLQSLDPDNDPQAEDRFVNSVMARIDASKRIYPMSADPLMGVWWLLKPALLAASLTLVISAGVIVRARSQTHRGPATVAEAVGIPPVFMSANTRDQTGFAR